VLTLQAGSSELLTSLTTEDDARGAAAKQIADLQKKIDRKRHIQHDLDMALASRDLKELRLAIASARAASFAPEEMAVYVQELSTLAKVARAQKAELDRKQEQRQESRNNLRAAMLDGNFDSPRFKTILQECLDCGALDSKGAEEFKAQWLKMREKAQKKKEKNGTANDPQVNKKISLETRLRKRESMLRKDQDVRFSKLVLDELLAADKAEEDKSEMIVSSPSSGLPVSAVAKVKQEQNLEERKLRGEKRERERELRLQQEMDISKADTEALTEASPMSPKEQEEIEQRALRARAEAVKEARLQLEEAERQQRTRVEAARKAREKKEADKRAKEYEEKRQAAQEMQRLNETPLERAQREADEQALKEAEEAEKEAIKHVEELRKLVMEKERLHQEQEEIAQAKAAEIEQMRQDAEALAASAREKAAAELAEFEKQAREQADFASKTLAEQEEVLADLRKQAQEALDARLAELKRKEEEQRRIKMDVLSAKKQKLEAEVEAWLRNEQRKMEENRRIAVMEARERLEQRVSDHSTKLMEDLASTIARVLILDYSSQSARLSWSHQNFSHPTAEIYDRQPPSTKYKPSFDGVPADKLEELKKDPLGQTHALIHASNAYLETHPGAYQLRIPGGSVKKTSDYSRHLFLIIEGEQHITSHLVRDLFTPNHKRATPLPKERLLCAGVHIVRDAVVALYGLDVPTGIWVDVSWHSVRITPVHAGEALQAASRTLHISLLDCINFFMDDAKVWAQKEIAAENRKDALYTSRWGGVVLNAARVAFHYMGECDKAGENQRNFNVIAGEKNAKWLYTTGMDLACLELYFKPYLTTHWMGNDRQNMMQHVPGLADLLLEAIMACDAKWRPLLTRNIYLGGDFGSLPGLQNRLHMEICHRLPPIYDCIVHLVDDRTGDFAKNETKDPRTCLGETAVMRGARKLARSPDFRKLCVRAEDLKELEQAETTVHNQEKMEEAMHYTTLVKEKLGALPKSDNFKTLIIIKTGGEAIFHWAVNPKASKVLPVGNASITELLEDCWEEICTSVKAQTTETNLLICGRFTPAEYEEMLTYLFDPTVDFHFQGVHFAHPAVLYSLALGCGKKRSGLTVELHDDDTFLAPVYDQRALQDLGIAMKHPVLNDLRDQVFKMASLSQTPQADRAGIWEKLLPKFSIARHYGKELVAADTAETSVASRVFIGGKAPSDAELSQAALIGIPEVYFQPEVSFPPPEPGQDPPRGLAACIAEISSKLEPDLAGPVLHQVYLGGPGARIPGMQERLTIELAALLPPSLSIQVRLMDDVMEETGTTVEDCESKYILIRGAKDFALGSKFAKSLLTLADIEKHGIGFAATNQAIQLPASVLNVDGTEIGQ